MSDNANHELFQLLEEYKFNNVLFFVRQYPAVLRLRVASIREKFQLFESYGFSKDEISSIFWDTPYLLKIKTFYFDLNLKFLTNVFGKSETISSILRSPSVLLYNPQKVSERVSLLRKYNFSDPIGFIEDFPSILFIHLGKIENRINYIMLFGFKEPIKVLENNPNIFEIRIEDFMNSLEELKKTYPSNYLEVFENDPRIIDYDAPQ